MIPTFKQTPLSSGALATDIAGEVCLRARWGLRQPLATWEKVARTEGVEEKARVVGRLVIGAAIGRKTAGARRRRIDEENIL